MRSPVADAQETRGAFVQVIYYGSHRLVVADDVASEVSRAATEFANEAQMIGLPVACYFLGRATTVTLVVGVGVSVLIDRAEGAESELPDPPETLASWDWIRTHTDDLQTTYE